MASKRCMAAAASAMLISAYSGMERSPASSSAQPTEVVDPADELDDGGFIAFFFPSEEASYATEAIRQSVIRDCMQQRGFELLSRDQLASREMAEIEAYEAALWGDIQTEPESSAPPSPDATPAPDAGCEELARFAVRDREPFNHPLYSPILDDYHSRLKSDPRMIAATEMWADCVESQSELLATTLAPLALTRGNIGLVREADTFIRQGRTVRWLSLAEADRLDTSALPQPVDMRINATAEIGYVASGPPTVTDADSQAALVRRSEELDALETSCWDATEGPIRIAELQREAMEQVAEAAAASEQPR